MLNRQTDVFVHIESQHVLEADAAFLVGLHRLYKLDEEMLAVRVLVLSQVLAIPIRFEGGVGFYGGGFSGSLGNGLSALAVYLPLTLVTLPFWLLGPLGAAISLLLNAWLNKRLFVYDALAEHATADELAALRRNGGWPLFGLAAVLGILHFVPLLNFFAPVYMGLAFTHYGLDRLARMRKGLVT